MMPLSYKHIHFLFVSKYRQLLNSLKNDRNASEMNCSTPDLCMANSFEGQSDITSRSPCQWLDPVNSKNSWSIHPMPTQKNDSLYDVSYKGHRCSACHQKILRPTICPFQFMPSCLCLPLGIIDMPQDNFSAWIHGLFHTPLRMSRRHRVRAHFCIFP